VARRPGDDVALRVNGALGISFSDSIAGILVSEIVETFFEIQSDASWAG
jgi:hypothetical protein